ncbi:MAG: NifB/NifX family molybdenum-iron cluster-binding protein [Chloroflexota bacterium]
MKIAVTAENNNGLESIVAQHFGHAPFFIMVDVENGEVTCTKGVANPYISGHAPGEVPTFIKEQNANVMLSGGMGGRAIQFFEDAGIKAATGASGTVRQSLDNYFGGKLTEAAPCDESVEHGHG